MNTKQMLSEIYVHVADKDIKFGCIVRPINYAGRLSNPVYYLGKNGRSGYYCQPITDNEGHTRRNIEDFETVGSPVMLGDFLEWVGHRIDWYSKCCKRCGKSVMHKYSDMYECDTCGISEGYRRRIECVRTKWVDLNKPIDEQPEETIERVHSVVMECR